MADSLAPNKFDRGKKKLKAKVGTWKEQTTQSSAEMEIKQFVDIFWDKVINIFDELCLYIDQQQRNAMQPSRKHSYHWFQVYFGLEKQSIREY